MGLATLSLTVVEDREERIAAKAINLPAWKTIGIDMEHIAPGHMAWGEQNQ